MNLRKGKENELYLRFSSPVGKSKPEYAIVGITFCHGHDAKIRAIVNYDGRTRLLSEFRESKAAEEENEHMSDRR